MLPDLVTLDEIRRTRGILPGILRRTPLLPLEASGAARDRPSLLLKAENLQVTGAYKPRAAFARVAALSRLEREQGIVLASSGNFAQAFALAGRLEGVRVVCVMLDHTSLFKMDAARSLGADVVLCGSDAASRQQVVEQIAIERGMFAIDTWEDRELIAGHGTLGLEILEDAPDTATVLVPVSSGGGAAGIATAIKASAPGIKVIGVQPEGANAAHRSRQAGRLVTLECWDSMADGLSAVRPGRFPFAHLQRFLDDIVLVTEAEIATSCTTLLFSCKLLAEPAGAVAAAAFLSGKVRNAGSTVALVSGGNIAKSKLLKILSAEGLRT